MFVSFFERCFSLSVIQRKNCERAFANIKNFLESRFLCFFEMHRNPGRSVSQCGSLRLRSDTDLNQGNGRRATDDGEQTTDDGHGQRATDDGCHRVRDDGLKTPK
jgi:hypothetical protein